LKALAAVTAALLLLTGASSEASLISAVRVEPPVESVRLLPANQYVICEACPPVTPLTARTAERQQRPPVGFTFSAPAARTEEDAPRTSAVRTIATVYFPLNSHRLKGGEKNKLRAARDSLVSATHLSVTGYTCQVGTRRHNDLLAVRRAGTVGGFLRTMGIPRERMEVTGKGGCCYVSDVRAMNRRVEITAASGP
jgi:outer membrane protein OmpA-like peptidoglycan-associated protein